MSCFAPCLCLYHSMLHTARFPAARVFPALSLFPPQIIMFSYELQRRLRLQGAPVDVFAVHPGMNVCVCVLLSVIVHF